MQPTKVERGRVNFAEDVVKHPEAALASSSLMCSTSGEKRDQKRAAAKQALETLKEGNRRFQQVRSRRLYIRYDCS